MTDDEARPPDNDPRRIVAVQLPALFPDPPVMQPTEAEQQRMAVSREWQRMGGWAQWSELHGATTAQDPGRMAEIFARIASSGEQLMLAGTCLRDARRWEVKPTDDLGRGIASRALAEMANYYALSAAHGLANVSLRMLLLHPTSRADLNRRFPRAAGFEPFTTEEQAWKAMNEHLAVRLAEIAASHPATVRGLIDQLVQLARDSRWRLLMDRRAVDFHRLRPQSIGGGAALHNAWEFLPNGQRSLSIGEFSEHEPPDADRLIAEAGGAVDALTSAAERWLDLFLLPETLEALSGARFFS